VFWKSHRSLACRKNISAHRDYEILAARCFAVLPLFCALCVNQAAPAFSMPASANQSAIVAVDESLCANLGQDEVFVSTANSNHRRAPAVSAAGAAVQKNLVSDELVAKARLHGSVRIIVQLRIAAGSDDSREQRIDAARQGLLNELAGVTHQVVRSFTAVPMIALEASYDALQVLNRSSHVLRVDDDGLAAPMNRVIEGKE
jgi:hypothetical protein